MYEMKIGDTFAEVFPFRLINNSVQVTDFTGWSVTGTFKNTSTGTDTFTASVSIGSSGIPANSYVTAVANTETWTPGVYNFDFRFRSPDGSTVITSSTMVMSVVESVTQ